MKAAICEKINSQYKLVCKELPKPELKDNEILVKVYASSLNAADYRLLELGFPPKNKILGADFSGRIEAKGSSVKNFQIGDSVFGDLSNSGFGGLAEYVAVPEEAIVLMPNHENYLEYAAIPLAGVTALQAIRDKGNLQKGESVLLVGSSGGVGTISIQIAKIIGASITAVCSKQNKEQTKNLGADTVIDYKEKRLEMIQEKFDLILGINGNHSLLSFKKLLKENGRYVQIGGSLKQVFKSLIFGKILFLGSKKMINLFAKSNPKDLKILSRLLQNGRIQPIIEKVYSLEEANTALEYISQGHARGKIIIRIN